MYQDTTTNILADLLILDAAQHLATLVAVEQADTQLQLIKAVAFKTGLVTKISTVATKAGMLVL